MNMLTKILVALFISITSLAVAQDRCTLKGKVVTDFDSPEGIYVINKTTEKSVTTGRGGYFTINASVSDTLIFSAVQFTAKDIVLTPEDIDSPLLLVPLQPLQRELAELIIVDYSHINAVSLGLVPAGQKQYTPAERKLATASSYKMNPLGLDPIFNAFSGRTAMLRQAAETEKKESLMEKIGYLYSEEDIIAKLNIPLDYVQGFIFYIVENKYFAKAVAEKNTEMAKFLMTGLADKYRSLLNDGK